MSDVKEFQVTGAALKMPGGGRRRGTRKNRREGQAGGDNSGALMQLSADSVPSGSDAAGLHQLQSTVKNLMTGTFGPKGSALQAGGDNSGGLLQVAQVPQMGSPMNTQNFEAAFRGQAAKALAEFGPDSRALQTGGKKQKGGDGISGTIQLSANRAPTLPGSPEPSAVISGVKPEQPASVGGGKIVLAPPKRKTRIALKAKKHRGGSDAAIGNIPPGPALGGGAHTRKARKIHLRVKGVTSRLAKAKRARKTAMGAPLSEVRQRLEGAGVIKKGSKAPEPMLRNMYADLLITKKGL